MWNNLLYMLFVMLIRCNGFSLVQVTYEAESAYDNGGIHLGAPIVAVIIPRLVHV